MSNLLKLTPKHFIEYLKDQNISRFYFVSRENSVIASHPQLAGIADFLSKEGRDFKSHEGIFVQVSSKFDTLLGAFIYRTCRGQGAGGVRYWQYPTLENYLRDGLRLSMGMCHKNALAGLWWGGGKGVMSYNAEIDKQDPEVRKFLYQEYGKFITSLNGCYVTAEDVGTNVMDMANIFSNTRFTTCIPSSLGGSGNPSVQTARGVIAGMNAALFHKEISNLAGKVVAV